MDTSEHQHLARVWAERLRNAAGDVTIPPHLAYRLAALVDPADAAYVDVNIPMVAGARMDIDVVVLTPTILAVVRSEQTTPPGPPRGVDATTVVSARSLRDLIRVEVAGIDADWETGQHGADPRLGNRSVTAIFADGSQVVVPTNDRAQPQLLTAVLILETALRDRSG